MAAQGLSVQLACRVLEVSESGYYARRSRAPSAGSIRHAWLTGVIREVHTRREAPTASGASTPIWSSGTALRSATRRWSC